MTFFSRFRILRFVAVRAWREPVLIFIKRNLFPAIFAFVLAFPGVSPVVASTMLLSFRIAV